MEWNTYYYDFNTRRIEAFNIFKHDTFVKYISKHFKDIKDRNEFANAVKRELQYFFWSKSEWELVVKLTDDNRVFLYPWCGSKNPENEKIEVTDETNFDWLGFAQKHINQQIYKNEAKIDVYDQVMFVWDNFVDYIWNQNKHFIGGEFIMYLKLDIDNVKLELNDIIDFFEKSYHLNPYWYETEDGCIYEEIRDHYDVRIDLDTVHRKAYDIYRQIKNLKNLENKSNNRK